MSNLTLSARIAARSGLLIAASMFLMGTLRIALNRLFDGQWQTHWFFLLKLSGTFGTAWFVITLANSYIILHGAERVDRILSLEPSQSDLLDEPMSGFVAMEYYILIWNRTFLVFIAPEGLYGWKVEGARTTSDPTYFEPYVEMIEDAELMRNRAAVRGLSHLGGGFFIPRPDIVSADAIHQSKWGMGSIPHSGRLKLHLVTGKSREFILLGSVSAEAIQQRLMRR